MMTYRRDIDGLRTLAVLPVLFFHAGNTLLSGGYAGVDIFFVISGFLITTILLSELDEGRFSLARFYERRIRRIFPLLFFVISLSLIAGTIILNPGMLLQYAGSALWALFSASNIYFWREDSYFSDSSELKPLLHTWSLAVEEQYYIVFPLMLMGLQMIRQNTKVLPLLMAIFFTSLALAQWGGLLNADTRHSLTGFPAILPPEFGYFLLPTRAWELMCGSIAAYIIKHRASALQSVTPFISNSLALIGLAMILVAYLTFDKYTPFPSAYTLLPVIGASLIILFNRPEQRSLLNLALSSRFMVFTGLISYSLYLWHQPVYAFLRIKFPEIATEQLYLSIPVIYGLSVLSWAYIERPFRSKTTMPAGRLIRIMAAWFVALIILLAIVIKFDGFIGRYPPFEQQFYISKDARGEYVRSRFNALAEHEFPENGKPNLLVIGDSHAQDLINILTEGGMAQDWNLSTLRLSTRCQLYIGPEDIHSFIAAEDAELCTKERSRFDEHSARLIPQADRVIIDFLWTLWSAERMGTTLQSLKTAYPQAHFTIVGLKYFGTISYDAYLKSSATDYIKVTHPVDQDRRHINDTLRHNITSVPFVDVLDAFCANSTECPIFTPEGRLISYDGGHLTKDGAKYLGSRFRDMGTFQ